MSKSQMWSEKYRPRKLDDVVGQKAIVGAIKAMIAAGNVPHLMFAGPAGVGKTTVASCIAREVLGSEEWDKNTLELNASDDRGIKMVREYVKEFAKVSRLSTDRNAGKHRFVILDEADEMTNEAQSALRRVIEDNASTTRFIIMCNNSSQIIEPIKSRCVLMHFARLEKQDVVEQMKKICAAEKVLAQEEALGMIFESTAGDMRRSINVLQAVAASTAAVTVEGVDVALGSNERKAVEEMMALAKQGKFVEARRLLADAMSYLTTGDFFKYANQEAKKDLSASAKMSSLLAEYEYRISCGANPEIQLTAFLADVAFQQ